MYPPAPPPYPPRRSIPVLVPHLIWEAVLLVVTAVAVVVVAVRTPLFSGAVMWWSMAYFGLLATGLALSLRTATPNLSVAGVASATGTGYGWLVVEGELPTLVAAGIMLVGAVVYGAVLGAITGLTSAPAWAVSLGGLAAANALALAAAGPGGVPAPEELPGPLRYSGFWFAMFLLISLAGGAIFAVPAVRRLFSANRTAVDPVRFGGGRLVGALVGFVGSSLVASFAGLALVAQLRASIGGALDVSLLMALGAALIGGVSVFGGRGGIAGTVLGVALLTVALRWIELELDNDALLRSGRWILLVVAILAGIGVSRLLELVAPVTPPRVPAVPPPPPAPPPPAPPPPAPPPPAPDEEPVSA